MSLTDKQITLVVARLFIKYDVDEDGFLDRHELKQLLNEAFHHLHLSQISEE